MHSRLLALVLSGGLAVSLLGNATIVQSAPTPRPTAKTIYVKCDKNAGFVCGATDHSGFTPVLLIPCKNTMKCYATPPPSGLYIRCLTPNCPGPGTKTQRMHRVRPR